MLYNFSVSHYGDELQVNFFDYYFNHKEEESGQNEEIILEVQGSSESDLQSPDSDSSSNFAYNKIRSTRRTKQTIYEIARANHWDYFVTFTFAEDRWNYDEKKRQLRKWFNNFKSRQMKDRVFEYLVVPELHDDGAIHFHGLIQGDLSDHISRKYGYNDKFVINSFRFGICEIEKVKNRYKVSNYITKYITKDLLDQVKNKRRFFYSSGLYKPKKEYFFTETQNLYDFISNNFPDYEVTYQYASARFGARYVQLKRKAAGPDDQRKEDLPVLHTSDDLASA